MADDEMLRFLFRWADGEERLYYAGGFQTGTHDASVPCIGIARTPKGQRPDNAETIQGFRKSVEDVAVDVRWFDDPI